MKFHWKCIIRSNFLVNLYPLELVFNKSKKVDFEWIAMVGMVIVSFMFLKGNLSFKY